MNKRELRKTLRQQRRALTRAEQRAHAAAMATHLIGHPAFHHARRIAAYLAVDGEADPTPLLERARRMGKQVFLPVLVPFGPPRLWFAPYTPGERLLANRFGILEPARGAQTRISPHALDLVITPLVAFDRDCNRMGMGAGFYDRSFAFLHRRQHWQHPRLFGLAYELQRCKRISANHWDVPLDAVVTEAGLHLRRT